jgi:Na(+)-translocating NADH:ubiquinone oxidoreductase F subunit
MVSGDHIECPKHNGRFALADGSPRRAPVCVGLTTYRIREQGGTIAIKISDAQEAHSTHSFRVVSNANVATFIKELTLEPMASSGFAFTPGDYVQLHIPAYEHIAFADFVVESAFAQTWSDPNLRQRTASNSMAVRRNYSLASNAKTERSLRFNVRLALPPAGSSLPVGIGSAYTWSLKAGDIVQASGPFGDFHIRPGEGEMVYIGGGAGMAPLRAHLVELLDNQQSKRPITFWYGGRSRRELFYLDDFIKLEARFPNFRFHVALSEPQADDHWEGSTGFIHDVLDRQHLKAHAKPQNIDYYLCGPPAMVAAVRKTLQQYAVPEQRIACDEF